ncbi:hypothetical protein SCREM1_93 [Synechococcus phage S-CREM1]|nr:hypothetical protein SCREM1_93 [Synechococcus phage S-CREM1]
MTDQDNKQTFYDDGAFYVEQTPYKLWHSFDKDSKPLITSLTKELCISATRFYLKGVQEGWSEDGATKYEGTVGGKL